MDAGYSVRSLTDASLSSNSDLLPGEKGNLLNTQDSNGRTPLHHAVISGSVKEVERCLSSGAAVDISDNDGDQPLHHAAAGTFQEIIRLLLKYGADVDAKGHGGKSPLHLSLRSPQAVRMLLKWHPMVSIQDDNGDSPLHLAMVSSVLYDQKSSIIRKLIQSGANVNMRNLKQITPFHMALGKSHPESKCYASQVIMFLESRADILLRTRDDRLPFEIFLENTELGSIKFTNGGEPLGEVSRSFKLFVDKGADLNVVLKSGEFLINEVLNGIGRYRYLNSGLAKVLCETADLTKTGASGDYPLHCALRSYIRINRNLVEIILSRGADPNQINKAGGSPLILLLSKNNTSNASLASSDAEIVRVLLEQGADPMLRGVSGTLPIYLAIANYGGQAREKLVKLLLKAMVSDEVPVPSSLLGMSDQSDEQ
jgi:ankyrin repeat protein